MATAEAPPQPVADPFTRSRIERIADRALRSAGVLGRLPTPLEEVQRLPASWPGATSPRSLPGSRRPGACCWGRCGSSGARSTSTSPSPSRAGASPTPTRRCTRSAPGTRRRCARTRASELFRATRAAIEAEANYGAAELHLPGTGVPRARSRRRAAGPGRRACARRRARGLAARDAAPARGAPPGAGRAARRRPVPGPRRRPARLGRGDLAGVPPPLRPRAAGDRRRARRCAR